MVTFCLACFNCDSTKRHSSPHLYLVWVELEVLLEAHLQHLLHPLLQGSNVVACHHDIINIFVHILLPSYLIIRADIKII